MCPYKKKNLQRFFKTCQVYKTYQVLVSVEKPLQIFFVCRGTIIPNEAHLIDEAKCLVVHLVGEGLHHIGPSPGVSNLAKEGAKCNL